MNHYTRTLLEEEEAAEKSVREFERQRNEQDYLNAEADVESDRLVKKDGFLFDYLDDAEFLADLYNCEDEIFDNGFGPEFDC